MVFCQAVWERLHFIFKSRVHVLNISLEDVKRCYCTYLMVNSQLILYTILLAVLIYLFIYLFFRLNESFQSLVMFEMFSHAGRVSSEEWKRLQAAQVLSKSVGFELHLS